jgi:hypothetical protein
MIKSHRPSPALAHVLHVWNHAPHKSNARFNGALYSALKNAIASGMEFHPDDLRWLAKENRLDWWLTDGGEGLYALACGSERGSENTSAALAFEKHLGRPAYLWAEETKTPARLHRGSQFTWQGHRVRVTSFNDDDQSLTACSYKSTSYRKQEEVGDTTHFDRAHRRIELVKRYEDGTICLRLGPPAKDETADIDRRFKITHAELLAARKTYDATRRQHERAIAAATTMAALYAACAAASDAGARAFRHFDLDILRADITAKSKALRSQMTAAELEAAANARSARQAENLRRWMAGEDVCDFFTAENRLRVKDGKVEVSNGNSVTLAAARATLAFVRRHRKKGWHANGETHDVDAFALQRVDGTGVTIGCTFLKWAEIDRIAKQL